MIAAATMSTTTFFDNFNVDVVFKKRSPLSQKVIYAILELVAVIVLLIVHPPVFDSIDAVFFVILSGASYAAALIPYYYALKHGNAVIAEIFEQTMPIFSLLAGFLFLGEALSANQFFAFGIILIAEFITIFAKKKRDKASSLKAAGFSLLAVLLWVAADLFFAKAGNNDYMSALFLILVGRMIVDSIFTFTHREERRHCLRLFKQSGLKKLWPTVVDFILEVGSDVTYRLALLLAPIALVSVTYKATELVFVFIFGIILTKIWPKFGREKLDKRTLIVNGVAIVLLITGIFLIG